MAGRSKRPASIFGDGLGLFGKSRPKKKRRDGTDEPAFKEVVGVTLLKLGRSLKGQITRPARAMPGTHTIVPNPNAKLSQVTGVCTECDAKITLDIMRLAQGAGRCTDCGGVEFYIEFDAGACKVV